MTSIQFDSIEFDPNALFTLSYSFEGIKLLLTSLTKNQQLLIDRLSLLEQGQGIPNIKVGESDSQIKQISPPLNIIQSKETQKISNINPSTITNAKLSELELRIRQLENKVQTIENIQTENKAITNLEETIDKLKFEIKQNKTKNEEQFTRLLSLEDTVDKIKVKVEDFNIYELFKDTKLDGGSVDATKLLIQNLENKIFKKFSLYDDRIKKDESDILKNKTDIINLQHFCDTILKKVDTNTSNIDTNSKAISSLKQTTKSTLEQIQSYINNQNQQLTTELNTLIDKVNKLEDEVNLGVGFGNNSSHRDKDALQSNSRLPSSSIGHVSDKDLKRFKEGILKKFYELEKKFIVFNSEINLDPINKDIDSLKEQIISKASAQEVFDLSERIQSFANILNGVKEDENLMMDEFKKMRDTNGSIIKKVETIQNQLLVMKFDGSNSNESIKNKISDSKLDNYLQLSQFNEFTKIQNKDLDRIHKDVEEFKRHYLELSDMVRERASEAELKNLEDYLSSLIEELKETFNKRFAGRIETNRNFKSVELQIKQVIEMYLKTKDKGNDWMLAKRPLNGHSCASCEAYIGDLKEKGEYLAWNKVPGKEQNDMERTFRVGNGFSRILNMLNVNNTNNPEKEMNTTLKKRQNTSSHNYYSSHATEGEDIDAMANKKKKPIYSNAFQHHNQNHKVVNKDKKVLPPLTKNEDTAGSKDIYNMQTTGDEREHEQPKV